MAGDEVGAVSPNLKKSMTEHDSVLATYVADWLRKRGKALRPKLNDDQKAQLEECFELMDADGSGAIDADELGAAFKLLGINAKKSEISQLLAEVDSDGSGEVEYPEFIQIMTSTLAKLSAKKEDEGSGSTQVPFALLATAYRRKRIMEGITSGDRELTAQVIQIAEEAAHKAADEAAHHQQEGRSRSSRYPSRSTTSSPDSSSSGHINAPPSLLRALTKVKSMKVEENHSRNTGCSSSGSPSGRSSGNGGYASVISELLAQPDAAKQLVHMMSEHSKRKQQQALQSTSVVVSQQSSTANSSVAGGGSNTRHMSGDDSVHFSLHKTSTLQQRQLTQPLELPKFVLNHKGTASGSSTPKLQQCSRSTSRTQSRPSGHSPATPSGCPGLPESLSIDHTMKWQCSDFGFRSPNSLTPTGAGPRHQQQWQELPNPRSPIGSSFGNMVGFLEARRSQSFNSLESCWAQKAPVTAAVVSRQHEGYISQQQQQQQQQEERSRSAGRRLISAANYAAVGLKH